MNQKKDKILRQKREQRIDSILAEIDELQESGIAAKYQIQKLEKELNQLGVDPDHDYFVTDLRSKMSFHHTIDKFVQVH